MREVAGDPRDLISDRAVADDTDESRRNVTAHRSWHLGRRPIRQIPRQPVRQRRGSLDPARKRRRHRPGPPHLAGVLGTERGLRGGVGGPVRPADAVLDAAGPHDAPSSCRSPDTRRGRPGPLLPPVAHFLAGFWRALRTAPRRSRSAWSPFLYQSSGPEGRRQREQYHDAASQRPQAGHVFSSLPCWSSRAMAGVTALPPVDHHG